MSDKPKIIERIETMEKSTDTTNTETAKALTTPSGSKRILWPEWDEHEYYDNETSYLGTLLDGVNEETTMGDVARSLNAKFGNNRSAAACRRQAEKHGFI